MDAFLQRETPLSLNHWILCLFMLIIVLNFPSPRGWDYLLHLFYMAWWKKKNGDCLHIFSILLSYKKESISIANRLIVSRYTFSELCIALTYQCSSMKWHLIAPRHHYKWISCEVDVKWSPPNVQFSWIFGEGGILVYWMGQGDIRVASMGISERFEHGLLISIILTLGNEKGP